MAGGHNHQVSYKVGQKHTKSSYKERLKKAAVAKKNREATIDSQFRKGASASRQHLLTQVPKNVYDALLAEYRKTLRQFNALAKQEAMTREMLIRSVIFGGRSDPTVAEGDPPRWYLELGDIPEQAEYSLRVVGEYSYMKPITVVVERVPDKSNEEDTSDGN